MYIYASMKRLKPLQLLRLNLFIIVNLVYASTIPIIIFLGSVFYAF